MSSTTQRQILNEVEVIQRFAHSYGLKFQGMIHDMNTKPTGPSQTQCLRLCVEAVNMVVNVQARLAQVLADMSTSQTTR